LYLRKVDLSPNVNTAVSNVRRDQHTSNATVERSPTTSRTNAFIYVTPKEPVMKDTSWIQYRKIANRRMLPAAAIMERTAAAQL